MNNIDIDRIRDLAFKLVDKEPEVAMELLEVALHYRPNGPAIIKSYNELKAKNINYFTEEQRIAYYSEKETPKNYFYKRGAITEEFSFDKIIPYQYGSYRNPKLSQSAKSYLGDLQELFNELPSGTEIPVSLGDGMIKKRELGFAKARKVGSNNTILLKLNKRRHWNYDIGLILRGKIKMLQ